MEMQDRESPKMVGGDYPAGNDTDIQPLHPMSNPPRGDPTQGDPPQGDRLQGDRLQGDPPRSDPPGEGDTPPPLAAINKDNEETRKKIFKEMSVREKVKYVASIITVEPLFYCYLVPSILSSITTLNLNVEKACRVNLNYNDTICSAVAARDPLHYTNESTEVLTVVAEMNTWMTALSSAGPAILVLFVGSWSDRRHRRKPLALSPIIGELFSTMGLLLCAIFLLEWPLEVAGIVEAVFPAISGGLPFMFIACYSYIGEVTSEEDRTFRIGLFAFFATLAGPLATVISGYMHHLLGYVGVYSLVSVLYVLAVLYAMYHFKEPTPPVPRPPGLSFVADFFDWHHIKNTVSVALKEGSGHRRLRVILLVILYITIEGPLHGENGNVFLFTINRYHWSQEQFGIYATFDIVVGLAGNALVTLILVRLLKIRDCYIGIIGVISRILAVPIFAFGYSTWHMYAGKVVSALSAGAIIGMRSLATKMVSRAELGQLMGFLAIVEAIVPVAFNPLYASVFASTLASFPGAFYLLTAAVSAIALISFLVIDKFQSYAEREEKKTEGEKGRDSNGVTNLAFNGETEKSHNTFL